MRPFTPLLLLGLAIPLTACAGDEASSPATTPAEAAATPKPFGMDRNPNNHCYPPEPIVFHCDVGKKWLSVCGSPPSPNIQSAQYRFGPPDAIELKYPADQAGLSMFSYESQTLLNGSEVESLTFNNGEVTYEVFSQGPAGMDEGGGGVLVKKGEEVVATVSCTGAIQQDLKAIQVGQETQEFVDRQLNGKAPE